jgi:hypothetical protein
MPESTISPVRDYEYGYRNGEDKISQWKKKTWRVNNRADEMQDRSRQDRKK